MGRRDTWLLKAGCVELRSTENKPVLVLLAAAAIGMNRFHESKRNLHPAGRKQKADHRYQNYSKYDGLLEVFDQNGGLLAELRGSHWSPACCRCSRASATQNCPENYLLTNSKADTEAQCQQAPEAPR
jgi:hypothetical protein